MPSLSDAKLDLLFQEHNKSYGMNARAVSHAMRRTILIPWGVVFIALFSFVYTVVDAIPSEVLTVIGPGMIILCFFGAYTTSFITTTLRAPFWAKAFLYHLELSEHLISKKHALILRPVILRAIEILEKEKAYHPSVESTFAIRGLLTLAEEEHKKQTINHVKQRLIGSIQELRVTVQDLNGVLTDETVLEEFRVASASLSKLVHTLDSESH
jgi:hypothetical protein